MQAVQRQGRAAWGYVSTGGWLQTTPVAASDGLYFAEYHDETGRSRLVRGRPGRPPEVVGRYSRFIPELAVINGASYVSEQSGSVAAWRYCLRRVGGSGPPVFCVPGTIERVLVDGATLTFSSFSDGKDRCADLYWVSLRRPSTLHRAQVKGCPFAGVAGPWGAAWAEQPRPDSQGAVDFFNVPIAVRWASGEVVHVGPGSAGSVRACGGDIVWNTNTGGTGAGQSRERLTYVRPDATRGTVLTAPSSNAEEPVQLSSLTCAEGGSGMVMPRGGDPERTWILSTDPTLKPLAARVRAVRPYRIDGTLEQPPR